jgi:iron-sulfur cluster repair protein YtfE (RIC family)
MPVVIGAKPESSFQDPIGLLEDCHRRIERFLAVLVRLAAKAGGQELLAGEQRIALETALRYFREAAPKHTRDEEDSLFPRLRSLNSPGVKSALAKVEKLEDEHVQMEKSHEEVDRLGQEWLVAGTLSPGYAARLCELVSGLAETYRVHIAVEEREVFPAAAAALAESDRAGIGGEMARRRGLGQS